MTDLSYRLDDFNRRLAIMEQELDELRRSVRSERKPDTQRVLWKPATPPPSAPPRTASPARKPVRARKEIDWSALFGAKALAWAGGAVTLLGIVFFFVLAVNRGWVGPVARVTLGALASVLLFSTGLYAQAALRGPVPLRARGGRRRDRRRLHDPARREGALRARAGLGRARHRRGDRRGRRRHRARVGLGADRRPRARRRDARACCGRFAVRRAERRRHRVRRARLRGDRDRRRPPALVESPRRWRRRDPPAGCGAARPGGAH